MLDKQKKLIFCAAIKKGCTYKAASSAVGICEKTVYNWLRNGRESTRKNCKYKQFLHAVKKAEHERQQFLLEKIIDATDKDWKSAAWLLERRDKFTKNNILDEIPEQQEQQSNFNQQPIDLFTQQAADLKSAMSSAMKSESWQAYAALQRQYIQVIQNINQIKAEQAQTDSLDNASDDMLRQEAVMSIISLPPLLRQEIIKELSRYTNVVALKK